MSKNCLAYLHRTVCKLGYICIDILDIYITIWIHILQLGYIYILQFGYIYCNLDINMKTRHIYI